MDNPAFHGIIGAWAVLVAACLPPALAMGQDVTVVTSVAGGVVASRPAPAAEADKPEGPLNDAREALSDILRLTAPEGKLALDRESWKAALAEEDKGDENAPPKPFPVAGGRMAGPSGDLRRLVARVQAKCGSNSGGMSMSNSRIQARFSGGSLEGLYTCDDKAFDFQVREQGSGSRQLRVRCGENGVGIQLMDDSGDMLLVLSQDANGAIRVIHVSGEQVFRFKASSYLALCRDQRQYMDKQFRPLLEGVGVRLPMTPWSEPVRSAILEMLKGKPADLADLLARLDSDKFAERDAATKALSAAFLVCHKELKDALENPSSSVEVKNRIQEVLQQNRTKMEPAAIVESLGLLRDADLLADMLKTAKSEEDRKVLTAALAKLKASPVSKPAK